MLKTSDVSLVEDEPRKTPWVFRGFCLRAKVQRLATSDKIKASTNMELKINGKPNKCWDYWRGSNGTVIRS
ncbi:hypothetical protein EX174_01210 [Listeria innocua]|nr:hypothetical protein [Listeria innocua]EAC4267019.1 hypothetical protein [Listeria innocua]EAD5679868.1 hypothetical protein [Listeria innocua]EAD5686988.1 hypothetical protein [Listeria innocua]EAD5704834.1 hypothetical protein [Listeria innocua]